MPALLTLSDVKGTGHHAAVVARVAPDHRSAVVGDGAVGLCGVIAANWLGAEQIILLGRHPIWAGTPIASHSPVRSARRRSERDLPRLRVGFVAGR